VALVQSGHSRFLRSRTQLAWSDQLFTRAGCLRRRRCPASLPARSSQVEEGSGAIFAWLKAVADIAGWLLALLAAICAGVVWWTTPPINRRVLQLQVLTILLALLSAIAGGTGWYATKRLAAPRMITEPEASRFLALLGVAPRGSINLSHLQGDAESEKLATQLFWLLRKAGWTVTRAAVVSASEESLSGITLTVRSTKTAPPYAAPLQHALGAIGLPAADRENPQNPEGSLELVVGHKPSR
jgi:hypothetical protein